MHSRLVLVPQPVAALSQAVKDMKIMKNSDACIVCNDGFDQCKSGGRLKKKINTGCFTKLYILHLDIGMYM